ncbi:MAG: hypothetical protein IJA80_03540 [Clostridia bacterium]|nr:hypothetical protein [Clostridia bacterium]
MEENNYLVDSFCASIGADVVEFAGETTELVIDSATGENGVLKDIPFVGIAVKLCNIASKVHEKHSLYKLKSFIDTFNSGSIEPEKAEARKKNFLAKKNFRKHELEYLLILIERYIGYDKPKMLAKLYAAYLDDIIIWDELTMYAEVIDRFLPLDCNTLISDSKKITVHRNIGGEAVLRLVALGLMVDVTDNNPFVHHGNGNIGMDWDSLMKTQSKDKVYSRTEFGDKLVQILK